MGGTQMLYVNKLNGKTYELTNAPDTDGICQVYDSETNSVMLMKYSELEYWKIAAHREKMADLKAAYSTILKGA